MTIYGVGLLAFCYLAGQLTGEVLGHWLGIQANVGGGGFAMLLLIFCNRWLERRNLMQDATRNGIGFWENLYIPVIVAMSASQDVKTAINAGHVALIAGAVPVIILMLMVPLIRNRYIPKSTGHE